MVAKLCPPSWLAQAWPGAKKAATTSIFSVGLAQDYSAASNPDVVADGDAACILGSSQAVPDCGVQRVSWRIELHHWAHQHLQPYAGRVLKHC